MRKVSGKHFDIASRVILGAFIAPIKYAARWEPKDNYKERDIIYAKAEAVAYEEEIPTQEELPQLIAPDDCPEFVEIFDLDKDTVVGVEYIMRCPDETAFIRLLGDTSFSKQYKRKVYTDKNKQKYIKVDNQKLYFKKAKTRQL